MEAGEAVGLINLKNGIRWHKKSYFTWEELNYENCNRSYFNPYFIGFSCLPFMGVF